ncbi:MAG: DUF302 domain-containing protein [Anaerolineae bacterium]
MFDDARTLILAVIMFALIVAPLLYFFRAVLRFSRGLELIEEDRSGEGEILRAPAVDYGMSTVVMALFEDVLAQTKEALRQEGFGVVAEIDVARLLEASGIKFAPYTVLTAWDAGAMTHVLKAERAVGLLMPARVIVFEVQGGAAVVAADPRQLLAVADNPNLLPLAVEARSQLQRAIDRLEVGTVEGWEVES